MHPVAALGFPAVYGWNASEVQRGAIQSRVWARVLGVDRQVVIEGVEFDEDAGCRRMDR